LYFSEHLTFLFFSLRMSNIPPSRELWVVESHARRPHQYPFHIGRRALQTGAWLNAFLWSFSYLENSVDITEISRHAPGRQNDSRLIIKDGYGSVKIKVEIQTCCGPEI
jgi:hypothetical protein